MAGNQPPKPALHAGAGATLDDGIAQRWSAGGIGDKVQLAVEAEPQAGVGADQIGGSKVCEYNGSGDKLAKENRCWMVKSFDTSACGFKVVALNSVGSGSWRVKVWLS